MHGSIGLGVDVGGTFTDIVLLFPDTCAGRFPHESIRAPARTHRWTSARYVKRYSVSRLPVG